jgi:hypothetical protein
MKRPVFVLGCPRSGTTLLYSLLLAAGGFAVYRKETYFYDLVRRFPELKTAQSQQRFMKQFLQGYLGKVPGLDVEPFVRRALSLSTRRNDFLPLLMSGIASAQHADRWIEATPAHLLYMDDIRESVPDALFVHVVRDGRDCALSNTGQHWISTLPWDRGRRLGVAALFWEWFVRTGRALGRGHRDYLEVQFEELIARPRETLGQIGTFIDHDLDYDRMLQNPMHSMRVPNTSFQEDRKGGEFNPVGRWRTKCSAEDLRLCEILVGPYLRELGYSLALPEEQRRRDLRAHVMRAFYLRYFATKHWLKARTPVGRFMTRTSQWAQQPREGEQPLFGMS